jgi:uncharacterized protein (DUF1778 family)
MDTNAEARSSESPRRPQGRTQTEPVLLRFEPGHLEMIDAAAEHLGLARASWIRSTLLQAAREVLKQVS